MTLKALQKKLSEWEAQRDELVQSFRSLLEDIEATKDEQREAFDNMPESIQTSENGQNAEARADDLDSLYDDLAAHLDEIEGVAFEVNQ